MIIFMEYITIYDLGVNQVHSSDTFDINRPDGLDKWLFLVVKSRACFILDGEETITEPNTAIFFKPGTPQLYHGIRGGENYQDHWMEFNIETNIIEDMGIPIARPITGFDYKKIDALFSLLLDEFYFGGQHKSRYIELFMTAILEKIREAVSSDRGKQDIFQELHHHLYLHPEKNWNVNHTARELNFSSSHFQNIYHSLFGISFGNDVIQSRISRACSLLAETDYSISQIAAMCGYPSDNYFVRQFKQIMGITPAKYRKQ